ncbi:UDP-galactopyranose mutase [Rahnella sp. BIGb0236]|uniref:UDP-galactopyranose mutase n=1 Tax=Rahnella sp. BIGb0236 TaxID=2485117 RepID=UPI00105C9962|nr:UDP-galactopyranose mutase [Rahnella sp. BIGb0236]TDS84883.1 UDP-galactopyranose mutase [Rahnella sp. BIGb0236]
MIANRKVTIVGAGLAGCTLARILADNGINVTVLESRDHVAGNCHDSRCPETGVMIHRYGPHIFHTDNPDVFAFLQRFTKFSDYSHRVRTIAKGQVWSLPVNMLTLNQFWKSTLTPQQARDRLETLKISSKNEAEHLEAQALQLMGQELYELFFKGYTQKQWGRSATTLPASILRRLPFRFNYDDRYFQQVRQGIPIKGYTQMASAMLDHPLITVHLNHPVNARQAWDIANHHHLFWTGPLDSFFNYEAGRLPYRTLDFVEFTAQGDFQGCAVMNYSNEEVPWTRITEHKHFMPEEHHEQTVCWREYSREAQPEDVPYYPIRQTRADPILNHYLRLAQEMVNVTFTGRLATYRYQDMDAVIHDAMCIAQQYIAGECPVFPESTV